MCRRHNWSSQQDTEQQDTTHLAQYVYKHENSDLDTQQHQHFHKYNQQNKNYTEKRGGFHNTNKHVQPTQFQTTQFQKTQFQTTQFQNIQTNNTQVQKIHQFQDGHNKDYKYREELIFKDRASSDDSYNKISEHSHVTNRYGREGVYVEHIREGVQDEI